MLEEILIDTRCDNFTDEILEKSYKLHLFFSKLNFKFIIFEDILGLGFCTIQAQKNTKSYEDTLISMLVNTNTKKR